MTPLIQAALTWSEAHSCTCGGGHAESESTYRAHSFLRLGLTSATLLLLPHWVGRSESPGQPRSTEKANKPHLVLRGASESRCRGYRYREGKTEVSLAVSLPQFPPRGSLPPCGHLPGGLSSLCSLLSKPLLVHAKGRMTVENFKWPPSPGAAGCQSGRG